MKIGVSSYSFAPFIARQGNDLFAAIAKAAEMGFDGIEFIELHPPGADAQADRPAYAASVRRACDDAGLPVVCYAVGADFLNPAGGGSWRDEVERLKTEIAIAAELAAPCLRHDATRGFGDDHTGPTGFDAAVDTLADACRAVAELAADAGLRSTVENHGFFVQDAERCERLVRRVDHANFGWLIDMGNFLCADDDPAAAVARLVPWAVHCHAKDFHVKSADCADPGGGWFRSRGGNFLRGAIVGHGDVDVPACLSALRAGGYDGVLSIEFEGIEDCVLGLEIGLANLRAYLDA
jgi:sugar phosphate isomerase/epimerase